MEGIERNTREKERQKKILMQEIEKEERLIRVYEADLEWEKSRNRPRPLNENEDEDDWLSMLDSLQSKEHSQETAVQLDRRWHDDPLLYRILPYVCGIAFDSAKPLDDPTTSNTVGFSSTSRSFEFQGRVCALRATTVVFHIAISICIPLKRGEPTRVAKASLNFPRLRLNDQKELQEISVVASETCNLPLTFRQLVRWAKFDFRRTRVLLTHSCSYPNLIQRVDPYLVRLSLDKHAGSYVDIVWKWKVSWYSSGSAILTVATHFDSKSIVCSDILCSKGLQQLVEVYNGNCQIALGKILQAVAQVLPKENYETSHPVVTDITSSDMKRIRDNSGNHRKSLRRRAKTHRYSPTIKSGNSQGDQYIPRSEVDASISNNLEQESSSE